jgi:hypothetical protein
MGVISSVDDGGGVKNGPGSDKHDAVNEFSNPGGIHK